MITGMLDRASILFRMRGLNDLLAKLDGGKPCPNNTHGAVTKRGGEPHGYKFLVICGDCGSIRCDRCPNAYCQCQNDE